ncbi:MAG: sugar ABC transporter permease [Gordonia sp. (in: high G+C Gram-positive bacteria)]
MATDSVATATRQPQAEPASRPAGNRRTGGAPRRGSSLRRRENAAGYLFLSPWLIGFFVLTAGPMLFSLYLAFTNYNIFAPPKWIGLGNFERMLQDDVWWESVRITLLYVVVGTPIKLAAALGVAMLLNYRSRGTGFFRSAFYAPSLIGASVSIAIVWRAMFSTGGPVDSSLSLFGRL